MKTYPTYKDSGISWIGQIPEHWEVVSLKKIFTESKEKTEEEGGCLLSLSQYTGILPKDEAKNTGMFEAESTIGYNVVHKGQFVMNIMLAWNGSYAVSDYDGIISPAYCVFDFNKQVECEKKYFHYLLRLKAYAGAFKTMSKGIIESRLRLYPIYFFSFKTILPPLSEQQKIVEFIEGKTQKIDACISEREKQLQLLSELKQRVIADAVTRGLNPNAPMKDSGISWIGQIPEHWEVRRLKYCFTERTEKNHPNEPILCATQSRGVIPQSMYENRVVVVNKGFEGLKFVKEGDFVISLRSFEGGIEYAYYQGIISAAYTILTPNNIKHTEYFKHLFKSFTFIQLLQTCVTGIREGQNINYSLLSRKFIPIPPLSEQEAIVAYIDQKCEKINAMVADIEKEINYLKEYKQRLIADAVTGAINVQ